MTDERKQEIDRNFDYFQRNLGDYLRTNEGRFALLRNAKLVGFFKDPGEAYREGIAQFSDALFSIQEVRKEPIELGHFAFDPY